MSLTAKPAYTLRDRDQLLDDPGVHYVLRVKDLPDHERPREKMLASGAAQLGLAELVAIIWVVGTRGEDVLAMAKRTIQEYGEKGIASNLSPTQLAADANIPLTKASQLLAAFEIGRRFYATNRAGRPAQVRTQKQAYYHLRDMGSYGKEQLRGLYLNSRYQVIHEEVISIGSLTANIVHPREVFQPAVEHSAIAVILAHNHPSDRLEPTPSDVDITNQLISAGQILGIDLLDHLIITSKRYISVLEWLEKATDDG